jgi:hypothetical protein
VEITAKAREHAREMLKNASAASQPEAVAAAPPKKRRP